MKKRLITILSLIMAFVLCFALVACGGDNETPSGGEEPGGNDPENAFSISLGDALSAVGDVLSSSYVGTAKYTLSTKETEPFSQTVSLDKRGNKVKVAFDEEEVIVDLETGYTYGKGEDGYRFKHVLSADALGYYNYVVSSISNEDKAKNVKVDYDEDTKTVTYVLDLAEEANKYIEPIQNAYKNNKSIGDLLDDYCKLLFGKNLNAMYKKVEDYVKDSKNTVGTLLDTLKEKGLDVEAILKESGYELPAAQMTAIKARKLNEAVAGAYKFVMGMMSGAEQTAEEVDYDGGVDNGDDDDDYGSEGGGMQVVAMGLIQAMLFDEVTAAEVTAGIEGLSNLFAVAKAFEVKTLVDGYIKSNKALADLYTVINEGVKLTAAKITLTLKIDDNKNITAVKFDALASHNYTGEAAEDSLLADNDYHVVAELTIDKSKASTAEFEINFVENYYYYMSVDKLVYDLNGNDVYVYFETAGNTPKIESIVLYKGTVNDWVEVEGAPESAVTFDAEKSMFKFDGSFVKTQLTGAEFGDYLEAIVTFEDEPDTGYGIILTYYNADPQAILQYYMTLISNIG